jgi:hypothetical protein
MSSMARCFRTVRRDIILVEVMVDMGSGCRCCRMSVVTMVLNGLRENLWGGGTDTDDLEIRSTVGERLMSGR